MASARSLSLAVGIAACGAILFGLGVRGDARDGEVAAPELALAPALPAAACAADDCGCPHEVVPASCCCSGRTRAEPERRPVRARIAPPVGLVATSVSEHELPPSALESFHCSGGKRGQASAEMRVTPAAAQWTTTSEEIAPERSWTPRDESGPPDDLRAEPSTPPPRPGIELELG